MRSPRVLVAYASRHDSTAEIATAIAHEIDRAGCQTTLGEVRTIEAVGPYDAAVIGSALYLGRWDDAAIAFLRREQAALAAIPTWLFSSGPVGVGSATARPDRLPQPDDVADLADAIGARSTTFGGRVDASDEGLEAQIMATAGLTGDWRDFGRIRAWGRAIGASILERMGEATEEAPNGRAPEGQP
jgi:menaquinone-dependent protoporphyrinogen oxidase